VRATERWPAVTGHCGHEGTAVQHRPGRTVVGLLAAAVVLVSGCTFPRIPDPRSVQAGGRNHRRPRGGARRPGRLGAQRRAKPRSCLSAPSISCRASPGVRLLGAGFTLAESRSHVMRDLCWPCRSAHVQRWPPPHDDKRSQSRHVSSSAAKMTTTVVETSSESPEAGTAWMLAVAPMIGSVVVAPAKAGCSFQPHQATQSPAMVRRAPPRRSMIDRRAAECARETRRPARLRSRPDRPPRPSRPDRCDSATRSARTRSGRARRGTARWCSPGRRLRRRPRRRSWTRTGDVRPGRGHGRSATQATRDRRAASRTLWPATLQ
jgi:hypothetical protein